MKGTVRAPPGAKVEKRGRRRKPKQHAKALPVNFDILRRYLRREGRYSKLRPFFAQARKQARKRVSPDTSPPLPHPVPCRFAWSRSGRGKEGGQGVPMCSHNRRSRSRTRRPWRDGIKILRGATLCPMKRDSAMYSDCVAQDGALYTASRSRCALPGSIEEAALPHRSRLRGDLNNATRE